MRCSLWITMTASSSLLLTAAVLGASPLLPADAAEPLVYPHCGQAPFFRHFLEAGQIREVEEGFDLYLVASQHQADCGALDGYGTELQLRFRFPPGKGCSISEVLVATRDYGAFIGWGKRVEVFHAERDLVLVEDAQLAEIILWSPDEKRAIKLLPNHEGFYYYEAVEKGGTLLNGLEGTEDDLESETTDDGKVSCCWGATQNYYTFEPLEEEAQSEPPTLSALLGPEPWTYSVEKYERPDPSCSNFFLFDNDLATFFHQARPSGRDLFLPSKCEATGKIRSLKTELSFGIDGAGRGYVKGSDGGIRLQCDQECIGIFPQGGSLFSRWIRQKVELALQATASIN